jgi:hypothetical protein
VQARASRSTIDDSSTASLGEVLHAAPNAAAKIRKRQERGDDMVWPYLCGAVHLACLRVS